MEIWKYGDVEKIHGNMGMEVWESEDAWQHGNGSLEVWPCGSIRTWIRNLEIRE